MNVRVENPWYKAGIVIMSACAVLLTVVLYLFFVKLDVIDDSSRKISLNASQYHVGDTVIVTSSAKKLQNVTGRSSRYIICNNPNNTVTRLNIGESIANRPARTNRSDIYLKIPTGIPTLPTTCFIEFNTSYGVFYKQEVSRTKSFKVLPLSTPQLIQEGQISSDTDNEVLENTPKNSATFTNQAVEPTSDTPTEQRVVQPQPQTGLRGAVQSVTDGLVHLVQRIL